MSEWLQQDDIWFELSKFPQRNQLPRLISSIQIPEKIAAFARNFLEEKWQNSPAEAMPFISGELDFEKNFLLTQLNLQLRKEKAVNSLVYDSLVALDIPEVTALAKHLNP